MNQLSRFFLLVYLFGSVILCTLLFGLQQFQIEQRWQTQLQTYAELLKVSVEPLLAENSAEQLSSQLLELQYAALLPISALGIYQASGEPLASAGFTHLLPTHLPSTLDAEPLFYVNSEQVAIVPLNTLVNLTEQSVSLLEPKGYLVIVPERGSDYRQSMLLASLGWLLFTLIFVICAGYLRSWLRQRDQQLSAMLQTLEHTSELSSTALTAVYQTTAFQPIHTALIRLIDTLTTLRQRQYELQSIEAHHTQSLAELTLQQQQSEQKWQTLQHELSRWLENSQLLLQRRQQLTSPLFLALTRLHLLYAQLKFCSKAPLHAPLQPVDWLAQKISGFNQLLSPDVCIDWLEDHDNANVVMSLDSALLEAVFQALLLLTQRSDNVTRVKLRMYLQRDLESSLVVHLTCDGQGLAPSLYKQITQVQQTDWQWRDSDLAILQLLSQQLNAKLSVQSLEALGLSVQLQLPVHLTELPFKAKMGHILVFDEDAERLAERVKALKALAVQVTGCHAAHELARLLTKISPDFVVLMIPAIAPTPEWVDLLGQSLAMCPGVVFVPLHQHRLWQSELRCYDSNEFCLNLINQQSLPLPTLAKCKNLLVVDDNETNQAFIRILLQHKAVNFHAAFAGHEVIPLCQQQQFDLILLDISLPDISGVEVAKQLRQLPAYEKTPILAFTAHALPAEIAAFKQAGMDDILLKPLDPTKFETLLARYQLY